jgi:hypothetical protein|tara:strand:- start:2276 stop:2629 length:354 start_codon:yes stop_codon:yes gene_type:complete
MAKVLSIDGGRKVLEPNRIKFPDVDDEWLLAQKDKDPSNAGLSCVVIDDSELPTSAQQAKSDANESLASKGDRISQKLRTASATKPAWAELSQDEQSEASRLTVIMAISALDADSEE